jgi:RNA 3'-terminal phosphate cyclase
LILGEGVVWDVGTVGEKITEEEILNRIHHYAEHRVCVDEHHQDQLLLLCVLANGVSRIRSGTNLSLHTQSLFYVIKSFIP